MQGASATSRNAAGRPGRGVPLGCPGAGRLRRWPSSECCRHAVGGPPGIRSGAGGNAPGAFRGAGPRDARRGEEGDAVSHRQRAATTQMAPNPLRPWGRSADGTGSRRRPAAMKGPGHRGNSGAPPAPWDGAQGAARKAWRHHSDEPERSEPPRARRPSGLPPGGASSFVGAPLRAVGTVSSRLRESAPARRATRREPPGGLAPGKEASEGRCWRPSDERADAARRADGPVPPGAGGSRRMALLASLGRRQAHSLPALGRLALLGRRHARGPVAIRGEAPSVAAPRPRLLCCRS